MGEIIGGLVHGAFNALIAAAMVLFFLMWRQTARRHKALKKYLADLAKKSQTEQELSLATTEQLLNALSERFGCFILLSPDMSVPPPSSSISIFVRGLPTPLVCMYLGQAAVIVATRPPAHEGQQQPPPGDSHANQG